MMCAFIKAAPCSEPAGVKGLMGDVGMKQKDQMHQVRARRIKTIPESGNECKMLLSCFRYLIDCCWT